MKVVITAAGKGTRLLPMTKELPKEMMPVFSKLNEKKYVLPLLQLIFEQLFASDIKEYCFVVGRGKRSIEDHFTPDNSFLKNTSKKNKIEITNFYKKIQNADLFWINQNEPKGFGDAVKNSEKFIGGNDFIVHAGDVAIIGSKIHPVKRLIEAGKDPNVSAVLLFRKVSDPERHGVPTLEKISSKKFIVKKVIEKPKNPTSNLGLMPIYYFKPKIFEKLKKIKLGKGNEFQLTDAIQELIKSGEKVLAIPLLEKEKVLDVGTVESYMESQITSFRYA
jgi:UTP--glucose-1-phosphate uridylyltransferase|tara:strand:+ start:400 stop:1230 length:831 start_codon:yes stop_codon:yes gene_type:complete